MPTTDERIKPLAQAWFYYPGQGDPVMTDPGECWYDYLGKSWRYGTSSVQADGITLLTYYEGIGLVCRPFCLDQDTRSSQFTTSGGSWEERLPTTGSNKYRLHQVATTVDVTWSAASTYLLPANPDFTLEVIGFDYRTDTTITPLLRFEWGTQGSQGWGLLFRPDVGNYLLQRQTGGSYRVIAELPSLNPRGISGGREGTFALNIQHLDDALVIDTGELEPLIYRPPDGSPFESSVGPVTFRGQAVAAGFGLHQIKYFTGTYTSPEKSAARPRRAAAALTFPVSWYSAPIGTSVAFADQSDPVGGVLQYQATLTPVATVSVTPFQCYRSPVLKAVQAEYPVVTDLFTGWGTYEEPFADTIQTAEIDKPLKLDEATASFTCRQDAGEQFEGNFRRRKVALRLGHTNADGSEELAGLLVGYVGKVNVRTPRYGEKTVSFSLENASIRFKESEWTDATRKPLGGQSINAAAAEIFTSEGLGTSYYSFHPLGDSVILPTGTPAEPFEYPRRGEKKWETLQRIFGYAGLELVPLDDGSFASGPRDYVSPVVTHEYVLTDADELAQFPLDLNLSVDYSEQATSVVVYGQSSLGEALEAGASDLDAETNQWSPRFCPWRVIVQDEITGPTTLGLCVLRAQKLAADLFGFKVEPDITTIVNLSLARRDRVRIIGSNAGAADYDEWVVLSLKHSYSADPSFSGCKTTAGLRRLN